MLEFGGRLGRVVGTYRLGRKDLVEIIVIACVGCHRLQGFDWRC